MWTRTQLWDNHRETNEFICRLLVFYESSIIHKKESGFEGYKLGFNPG